MVLRTLKQDSGEGKPFLAPVITLRNLGPFTNPARKGSQAHEAKSRD